MFITLVLLNPGNEYPSLVSKEIWTTVFISNLRVIEFENDIFYNQR